MNGNKNGSGVKTAQLRRRVDYLVGARLKPRDKMAEAVRTQDRIRSRRRKASGWDCVSAIRAARDSR